MSCSLIACICCSHAIPQRVVVTACLFLSIIAVFGTRMCFFYTIDKIVVNSRDPSKENEVCKLNVELNQEQEKKFSWSYKEQSTISIAFITGYLITHVPGGLLSDSFGGKYVLFVGLLVSGILSVATPFVIGDDYFFFVVLRFLMGLAQGPMYPCTFSILANWVDRTERSLYGSLLYAAGAIGTAVGNIIAFVLLEISDWKNLYYLWGGLTLVWTIFYVLYCYSDPSNNPHVSPEELAVLNQKVGSKQVLPIPWKMFLTSSAVWGFLFGYLAVEILGAFYIYLLPEYFYNIVKYDRTFQIRLIPSVLHAVSSIICGIISDQLIVSERTSILKIRRIMGLIGTIIPALFLIGIPLFKCEKFGSYCLYVFGMLFLGPADCGIKINVLDFSRNFVGFTLGIVNCVGAMVKVFLPKLIYISQGDDIFQKWEVCVLFGLFSILVLMILYCCFVKTEPQEWDENFDA